MKIGIDLGTANVLVFVQGSGITVREPSVVAINDRDQIVAVGNEAKEMLGRTPGSISAIRPLRDGVIADYVVTEAMLRYFIKKGTAGRISFGRPDVLVSVPTGSTSVEKRSTSKRSVSLRFSTQNASAFFACSSLPPAIEPDVSMTKHTSLGTDFLPFMLVSGAASNRK